MTGPGRDALERFADELRRLRRMAGSPSLNQLAARTAALPRPLPRSTISDKLTAKSLPDWDFVLSFLAACAAYAEETGVPLPADAVDLARWDRAHWELLRALDDAQADARLAAAAQAETDRRGGSGLPRALPRQLPPPVGHFAGRVAELAALGELDAGVVCIDGTAGVGKTTLALQHAHRLAPRYPDGQLYLNLRGFDPAGAPMTAEDAVRAVLEALAVPAERIPADLDARVGLYRSLVADRRVLVLADNARTVEQVRPLLPGSPASLVIVTSRNRLTGLVATADAHPLTLDLFTAEEARDLLAHRLGTDRVAAEPEAVRAILDRCAHLPLALAIVGARAAQQPRFPLATLADALAAPDGELDALGGGDPETDVRRVFSWSYRQLSAGAARVFRLLGLHCGPDLTGPAGASLAGTDPAETGRMLAELTRTNLVKEHRPGRFTVHDLLRAYTRELARTVEPEGERRAALDRVLDHYLHSAAAADRLLDPHRDPIDLAPPRPGVVPEQPVDPARALGWFTAEHAVLVAAVRQAAGTGEDLRTWRLAWTLTTFLQRRGHWQDWAAVQEIALAAARRLGDLPGQALSERSLGAAYARMGETGAATAHYERALELSADLGDATGQAHTHINLAFVLEHESRFREALGHSTGALDLYRATGHRVGEANALNAIGWHHARLADYGQAIAYCERALDLHRELNQRQGEAATWDSLGYAHHHLGHHAEAIDCYRHAVELARELGESYYEATSLTQMADAHEAAGQPDAARQARERALMLLDELGHPDADRPRAVSGGSADGAGRP